MRQPIRLMLITLGIAAAFLGASSAPRAEDAEIAQRRASERKSFTDAEIIDGFFKTAIGAEFNIAGSTDRIRKYADPIRVYIKSHAKPDRSKQIEGVVKDIAGKVRGLDIALTDDEDDANVIVTLVRDRDMNKNIARLYGRKRAKEIERTLDPQCLSGFGKDEKYQIQHSEVLIAADTSNFIFYDCAYEELLQSIGPINDTDSNAFTMFNDDVQMGFFDVFDQYILNILYHPLVKPGMTADEVRAVLPQVLPDVRAFVKKTNSLPD